MESTKKITVLLPTRGRPELLEKSIKSLMSKATNPKDIEIMLGLDEDDTATTEYIKETIAPYLQELGVEARANIFKPLGYENLHTYVNTLAGAATGEWLFFWNDDGLMETQGWDDVINSYTGQFKLLAPRDNHNGHPYAIFPVVPRDWYILVGHLSQNAQNDAWLSHIAYMLDVFERIDVEFIHDRADITGNNDDETFRNRKYMEGNPSDPKDFGHEAMQHARVATAHKIAWFLERTGGTDLSWWNAVKAGEQDPFEKMQWAEGVKGAGQLASVNDDQLPDDTVLTL
jgi:glycosyltransferase involved in cell wall biosynthesis